MNFYGFLSTGWLLCCFLRIADPSTVDPSSSRTTRITISSAPVRKSSSKSVPVPTTHHVTVPTHHMPILLNGGESQPIFEGRTLTMNIPFKTSGIFQPLLKDNSSKPFKNVSNTIETFLTDTERQPGFNKSETLKELKVMSFQNGSIIIDVMLVFRLDSGTSLETLRNHTQETFMNIKNAKITNIPLDIGTVLTVDAKFINETTIKAIKEVTFCKNTSNICQFGHKCEEGSGSDMPKCKDRCVVEAPANCNDGTCAINTATEQAMCRCNDGYFRESDTCKSHIMVLGIVVGVLGGCILLLSTVLIVCCVCAREEQSKIPKELSAIDLTRFQEPEVVVGDDQDETDRERKISKLQQRRPTGFYPDHTREKKALTDKKRNPKSKGNDSFRDDLHTQNNLERRKISYDEKESTEIPDYSTRTPDDPINILSPQDQNVVYRTDSRDKDIGRYDDKYNGTRKPYDNSRGYDDNMFYLNGGYDDRMSRDYDTRDYVHAGDNHSRYDDGRYRQDKYTGDFNRSHDHRPPHKY